MVDVIIVGRDWQSRALLRAQLIEEGIDVEAHEAVAELGNPPARPHPKARFPKLLVADVFGSNDPEAELGRLAGWAKHFPVWIIVSPNVAPADKLKGGGFEEILFRPVDLGDLVERIKQRIK